MDLGALFRNRDPEAVLPGAASRAQGGQGDISLPVQSVCTHVTVLQRAAGTIRTAERGSPYPWNLQNQAQCLLSMLHSI